jgi:WD40 repeat protein
MHNDKTMRVWDVHTGECKAIILTGHEGHGGRIISVAISADNSFIVTGSWDKTARVWDTNTYQCIATLTGHTDAIESVAISADNSFIVTGSRDHAARIWDTQNWQCTATLTGHASIVYSVAISSDNSFIVTAGGFSDKTARVWSIAQALKQITFDEALAIVMSYKLQVQTTYTLRDREAWSTFIDSVATSEAD